MELNEATRLLNATQLMLLGKDNQPISDLYYALQIALDLMEKSKWIPVSERLPEPRVAVEVYCPEYRNQYCAFYDGTHWRVFGTRNTDEVTYWKPLSQVPEESEDK